MIPRPGLKPRTQWWKASALLLFQLCGGGQRGGGGDQEKRAGGVREVGEEGEGSRIPKVVEIGEKGKNYATLCNQKNAKRQETTNTTRIKGYGKREV